MNDTEFVFEPSEQKPLGKYYKDFWMDDVRDVALKATELIQTELKKYGIKLEDKEEDLFYVPMFNTLESFSNGNYRHEH